VESDMRWRKKMNKKLKLHFIFTSILSAFIVLIIMIGYLNIRNYQETKIIAEKSIEDIKKNNNIIPMRSLYFIYDSNTKKIINNNFKIEIDSVLNDLDSNANSGFLDGYYYESDNGVYYFVDVSKELDQMNSFLYNSIEVSLVGLLIVSILVIFLSNKVIKPVIEAEKKQKEFITNASHELKTPLSIIQTNNELVELDYGENDYSSGITKQVRRLSDIVNSMISLTRLDEMEKIDKMTFSLSNALYETINLYNTLAKKQSKVFITNIEVTSYYGSERDIRQLISILLENAIKYSCTKDIKITLKNKVLRIENAVENIELGDHNELFGRFYRRDESRNSLTGGTGIGLSLAYRICELHKAKIFAYTKYPDSLTIEVRF